MNCGYFVVSIRYDDIRGYFLVEIKDNIPDFFTSEKAP